MAEEGRGYGRKRDMKKIKLLTIAVLIMSFIAAVILYPLMPEMMASHWNAQGEVDGYMPRVLGLFLMPAISLAILILFIALPRIDPLKENIAKFKEHFDIFVLVIILFFAYIYTLSILWNLGFRFSMTQMIIPAIAILFYCAGVVNEKAKRNWFIGIRTPWTLSSDLAWEKTHKAGGLIFKFCGILCFAGIFIEKYAVAIVILPIIAGTIFLFIYSFAVFTSEKKAKAAGKIRRKKLKRNA